jgi:hypothetical protein
VSIDARDLSGGAESRSGEAARRSRLLANGLALVTHFDTRPFRTWAPVDGVLVETTPAESTALDTAAPQSSRPKIPDHLDAGSAHADR